MSTTSRRSFLAASAVALGTVATASSAAAEDAKPVPIILPPAGKRILLSCKLGMIAKKDGGKDLSLVERLKLAAAAGFDGVDFDEAGIVHAGAGPRRGAGVGRVRAQRDQSRPLEPAADQRQAKTSARRA